MYQTDAWGAPLSYEYRHEPASRVSVPVLEPPAEAHLPMLHVAQQVLGHEIQRLRAAEVGIEAELTRGVIGANGAPVPHLVARAAENRAALEQIREDIGRLSSLSNEAVRHWAMERGVR